MTPSKRLAVALSATTILLLVPVVWLVTVTSPSREDLDASAGVPPQEMAAHPLDPLTATEYARVVRILKDAGRVGESALYPLVSLFEPAKEDVLQWRPGLTVSRRAVAVVKTRTAAFEAVVDLGAGRVVSWTALSGVQPAVLLSEEPGFAQRIVWQSSEFRAAMERRGVVDPGTVVCLPHTVGLVPGTAPDRRRIRMACYDREGTPNYWGRPFEGLIAEIDLDAGEVVRVDDTGTVPLPRAPVSPAEAAARATRDPLHPVRMQQEAPSFTRTGHVVRWQNWQFHLRVDPRVGPVVSLVRYDDAGRSRSVLYQGSVSELFVPYMDPSPTWRFRSYLDAGEYGLGKLAARLRPGLDCPVNAEYLDAVLADDWGESYVVERAACLFERVTGDVAWRHDDTATGSREVRVATDLVARFVAVVGNYDYVLDWIFQQDGTIRVAVASSGVMQVKAVDAERVSEAAARRATRYGRMVASRVVAINHDHFFSFRLDLDVDGPTNTVVIDRLVPVRFEEGPRRSGWAVESVSPVVEADAKLRIDLERPALWRVVNPDELGPVGYPTSYQLLPGPNAVSLVSADDPLRRRAGFIDHHLWVTPLRADERYAAGRYPNQSAGGQGLPAWTSANRSVERTDLVLWYTLGMHHVPRAEDWPILPRTSAYFELRPFDFFEYNPALDLPPRSSDEAGAP